MVFHLANLYRNIYFTGYKIKNDGKLCVPYFLPNDAFMICIIGKSDMHNYLLVNQKGKNSKFYVTFPFIFTLRQVISLQMS